MFQKHIFGRQGEELAATYFEDKGFFIREKNYYWKGTEIDFIAENQDYIVFVEVKTRHKRLENPENFFPKSKKIRMIRLANYYVNAFEVDKEVRFDLIIIDWDKQTPKITHIENAFLPQW